MSAPDPVPLRPVDDESRAPPHWRERVRTDPELDRVVGTVIAAAAGDAIGHPTEFLESFDAIWARYGRGGVTGFTLFWERNGQRFAPYTDDTQMAEVVLRTLLWSKACGASLDETMTKMGEGFVAWAEEPQGGHRAPGNACLSGCRALAGGAAWSEAGGPRAGGCGSVMRAYPFGLVFRNDPARAVHWAVEHSRLTHRDPIALAACAAMATGVAHLVSTELSIDAVLEKMELAAREQDPTTADMISRAADEGQAGIPPSKTFVRLQAWAAHEAIAAGAYLLARNPTDLPRAILEGANTPGDSDSIATVAGALVGARRGVRELPMAWVEDLERSDVLLALATRIVDDG